MHEKNLIEIYYWRPSKTKTIKNMLQLAQNEYFSAFLKTTPLLTIRGTSER
jgi:hypothetical protein